MRISDWSSDVCSSDLRGISDAMIDRFGIGFAPGSKIGEPSPLMRALDGVDPKDAEQLGLVKRNPDSGNVYDFFRRRIIIPIHDARGGVIGFGGRILGDRSEEQTSELQSLMRI